MALSNRQKLKNLTDEELTEHIYKYTELIKEAEEGMKSDDLGKLQLAYNKLCYARGLISAALKEQVRRDRHQ
jgi:hypothetical protein